MNPSIQKLPASSCSPFEKDDNDDDDDDGDDDDENDDDDDIKDNDNESTSMKLSCFWSLEFCSLNKLSSSIMQQRLATVVNKSIGQSIK